MKVYVLSKSVMDDCGEYRPEAGLFKGVFSTLELAKDGLSKWYMDIPDSPGYKDLWEPYGNGVWLFREGRVGRWKIHEWEVV